MHNASLCMSSFFRSRMCCRALHTSHALGVHVRLHPANQHPPKIDKYACDAWHLTAPRWLGALVRLRSADWRPQRLARGGVHTLECCAPLRRDTAKKLALLLWDAAREHASRACDISQHQCFAGRGCELNCSTSRKYPMRGQGQGHSTFDERLPSFCACIRAGTSGRCLTLLTSLKTKHQLQG